MSDDDFLQLGDLPPMSRQAFQLHSFALVDSVQRGTPGFVSDDYLGSIPAETSFAAVELETAGLWSRRDGGYFVHEYRMLNSLLTFREEQDATAAVCRERGHHDPVEDGNWTICATCGIPLKRPDGKSVGGADGNPPNYGD